MKQIFCKLVHGRFQLFCRAGHTLNKKGIEKPVWLVRCNKCGCSWLEADK